MNAPSGVIVALFAIALGYILKTAAFFPNNRIPLVVVLFTAVLFPLVQFCAKLQSLTGGVGDALLKTSAWLSIPLNLLIGVIIGFTAWLFHNQILKRWIDPKLFNDDGSTKFLSKPKATADESQPQTDTTTKP